MTIRIPSWLSKRGTATKASKAKPVSPYRAVAVESGLEECCSSAQAIVDKRYLLRNAPPLPLPGCSVAQCKCHYVKFEDRRQDPRRGDEFGIGSTFVREVERRNKGRGRRQSDH